MAIEFKLIPNRHLGIDGYPMTQRLCVVSTSRYDFYDMARDICEATSLTPADVYAVMIALLHNIHEALLAGRIVELQGLGSFQLTVKSRLCTPDETELPGFDARRLIHGYKVLFRPTERLKRDLASLATLRRKST